MREEVKRGQAGEMALRLGRSSGGDARSGARRRQVSGEAGTAEIRQAKRQDKQSKTKGGPTELERE